jgi:3-phosphoshikimate 1-carboxyvinyltransferase
MSSVRLTPPTRPFDLELKLPGSKSLTNRALVLAALAKGNSTLTNALFADDTRRMIDCLQNLGFAVTPDEAASTIDVVGTGGMIPSASADLFVGNSGTTIRFVAALCTLGRGTFTLDGIERMRQRPIRDEVVMLRNLAARIDYLGQDGMPPIRVRADTLPGGTVAFGDSVSSQYLSALLHVGPYTRHELQVRLVGKQSSWPYVEMTMRLMDEFGVTPELERDPVTSEPTLIVVPRGVYAGRTYAIEPDASNASYFLAAAAMSEGSRVKLLGLGKNSLQGDVKFAEVLRQFGATVRVERDAIEVIGTEYLDGIDADFTAIPDTAQTAAVVAAFASGPSVLRGLHTLRVKETDRVAALQNELTKLGCEIEIAGDAMHVTPADRARPASIDTYDDHRMAMAFALAGLRTSGLQINDPGCTGKTFPDFFDRWQSLGVGVN